MIQTSTADGVATIVLNDPDRRNALSAPLVADLVAAVEGAEADPDVRAIVITGAGTAFCAGAALEDLEARDEGRLRTVYEAFLRIARSPLPTIAAVNGPAVGAGMNLALACDVRVAGRSARFDARFLTIGLHPGGGHTWMLQRLVGPQAATAMVLLRQRVEGARAVEIGLAWSVEDDDALLAAAQALAGGAAKVGRELLERTKASLRATADMDDHAAAVELELAPQLWSMHEDAFAATIRPEG